MFESFLRGVEALVRTPGLLLNPNPASYYDYLGDDVIEGQHGKFKEANKPLWLNLGYWKTARSYPEAAAALATKLGDAAKLGANDSLLDVGFGFAEQDFFFIQHYGVKHITGVNITPMQVERSKARVTERGLDGRVDLQVGSATDLKFAAGSFDKIVALECAHHFDTRQKFFEEAFRVLRSGGTLATADGTPYPGDGKLGFLNKIALKRWFVPLTNMYDRDEYCRRLEQVGFVNVKCESIRNYVFPGVTKYHAMRNRGVPMSEAIIELSQEEIDRCAGIELWKLTGLTDYVIFSADKP